MIWSTRHTDEGKFRRRLRRRDHRCYLGCASFLLGLCQLTSFLIRGLSGVDWLRVMVYIQCFGGHPVELDRAGLRLKLVRDF